MKCFVPMPTETQMVEHVTFTGERSQHPYTVIPKQLQIMLWNMSHRDHDMLLGPCSCGATHWACDWSEDFLLACTAWLAAAGRHEEALALQTQAKIWTAP